MTITILPFLVDDLGGNPQPVGDPIDRDWPGDTGPLVGDTIPTCADGMLQPVVMQRRWCQHGAGVRLFVTAWGREAKP